MNTPEGAIVVYEGRHARTTQNADTDHFYGGGPDDVPERGPVPLDKEGVRQGLAMGYGATAAGLAVKRIVISDRARTRQTAELFLESYGQISEAPLVFSGIHEVGHGSLERRHPPVTNDEAKEIAALGGVAIHRTLKCYEVGDRLNYGYGDLLRPLGSGDGESYLLAGIRVTAALDTFTMFPGTLLIGHHGAMRQAYMLMSSLTRAQRQELTHLAQPLVQRHHEALQNLRKFREAFKREPDEDELMMAFSPIGRDAEHILRFLKARGVPTVKKAFDARYALANGAMVETAIHSDGKWERRRVIEPILPEPTTEELTENNVRVDVRPYGTPARRTNG